MKRLSNILKVWLPLAVVIIGMGGLVYLTVQQALRMSLNDPQIRMAEDAASALAAGQSPDALVSTAKVDVAQSLAPFVIVYDDAGNVIASSVVLHGETPVLPSGVLDYARTNGEDRVTWQPEAGVRIAAIVVRAGTGSGFVLAGRNMREVEKREDQTLQLSMLAMAVTLIASLVVVIFFEFVFSGKKPN
jgi:hypothetical protein